MNACNPYQKKDIRLLGKFVEVYCSGKHPGDEKGAMILPEDLGERQLCAECSAFLEYAIAKRLKCPLEDEKPSCKKCRIHCYDKVRREKVREIMAYAGRRLIVGGRLDYLWHYLF